MRLLFLTSLFIAVAPFNATAMSFPANADTVYILNQYVLAGPPGPQPVAGWDVIKRRLSYPENARKLRFGCAVNARALLDSGGSVQFIHVSGIDVDSEFLNSVHQALSSTAWSPYRKAGTTIEFHIAYVPQALGQPLALVIERSPISGSFKISQDSLGKFVSTCFTGGICSFVRRVR